MALKIRGQIPFPRIFLAQGLEEWGKFNGKTVSEPALGGVFVKTNKKGGKHVGIASGPEFPNGQFPSVEGNTWANTTYEARREGVYALKSTLVTECTFIRL